MNVTSFWFSVFGNKDQGIKEILLKIHCYLFQQGIPHCDTLIELKALPQDHKVITNGVNRKIASKYTQYIALDFNIALLLMRVGKEMTLPMSSERLV